MNTEIISVSCKFALNKSVKGVGAKRWTLWLGANFIAQNPHQVGRIYLKLQGI